MFVFRREKLHELELNVRMLKVCFGCCLLLYVLVLCSFDDVVIVCR